MSAERPERRQQLEIVHLDDRLGVVDKPAGVVVHPAPGTSGPTLVDMLGDLLGGGEADRPGIVHRLDRDTSGLMLFARDLESHAALSAMIAARDVVREYLALIEGKPRSRTGSIDAALGRDRRRPERRAVGGRGARDAVTHFEVIETMAEHSLCKIRLETGRTHQIRVHMAAVGHPVCGDATYGSACGLALERQFLHAARLRLDHPFTDAVLDLESALPPALQTALQAARGYHGQGN